jgi:outer membrane protein assembly factor BamB
MTGPFAFPLRSLRLCVRLLGITLAVAGLAFTGAIVSERLRDRPVAAVRVVWTFEQPERGAFIATPAVTEEFVYAAAVRDSALAPSGVVYCLDRRSGVVRWRFDDNGAMLHTCSSPCYSAGRLYLGEGMHGNDVCKLYCLDAASGRKLWQRVTGGHIECGPCVAGGAVFFASGDDGVYCLDASSGEKRWHFQGRRHIDTTPTVANGRVYAGSGVSLLYRTTEIFCFGEADGKLLWHHPTELPVWSSPVVEGEQVFLGTGTGRLTVSAEPPEKPAGALLCADVATGQIRWSCRLEDAVFSRPTVDEDHVYFGSRDGRVRCLDRRDGRQAWEVDMGSPVVTQPALIAGRLYVIAAGGQVKCLDAADGRAVWTFDVAAHTQTRPQLLSSPVVVADSNADGEHHLIFFGAELRNAVQSTAVLFCLRD